MLKTKIATITMIYYFVFVCINFFLETYLIREKGIDQVTIGYISGISIIFMILSFVYSGYISDKFLGNKKMLFIGFIITIISFILYITLNNKLIEIILNIILFSSFLSLAPIIDGLILKVENQNYTFLRLFGSLGAAISYFCSSFLLGSANLSLIFIINIILLIISLILIATLKIDFNLVRVKYKEGIKETFQKPIILGIIILTIFTYGLQQSGTAFVFNYEVGDVHLNGYTIGIIGFFSILIEVIGMYIYNLKIKKVKPSLLLLISIIILMITFGLKYFAYQNQILVIISDLLLGFFTFLYIPTVVLLINKYSHKNTINTILSIYQLSIRIGASIFGFLITIFYSYTKLYYSIYLIYFMISIIVIIIYIITINNKKIRKENL